MPGSKGPPFAPGSRALAALLLIGLVGVLAGRAIWAGGNEQTAVPSTSPAPQASASAKAPDPNSLDSVISGSAAGLSSCLNDVAGSPAPADEHQATSQEQFITILSGQLQQLRGLSFKHPVQAKFLTGPQIEKRISELIDQEAPPGDSGSGAKLLTALGAIAPGDDPAKIERQALKGQVAGLYVPETGELLVRSGRSINITDTITVVHELDHALTDQALGGIRESFGKGPNAAEEQSAYTALVEGDATITMEAYLLRHGSFNDQLDMLSELGPANKAQDDLETYPYYFQRQLLFPYLDGLRFDCELFKKGGWKAVDEAYRNPPQTTAEVMFPERYGEKPAPVEQLPELPKPWKSEFDGTAGAADLEWLFAAPGDDTSDALSDPRVAAGAWDGGRVELWAKGDQTAVALRLNDRSEGLGLCHSVAQWYGSFGGEISGGGTGIDGSFRASFENPGNQAELQCQGKHVRLSIAPSRSVAKKLDFAPGGGAASSDSAENS